MNIYKTLSAGPGQCTQVTRGVCGVPAVSSLKRKSVHSLLVVGVLWLTTAGAAISWAAPAEFIDANCIRAIVGEAGNQGRAGMLMVAGAIRNRGTLRGVYGVNNPIVDKQPEWCWRNARAAWASSLTNDISRGATHWENVRDFGAPAWSRSMAVTTNLGRHVFFKDPKWKGNR